MKRFQKIWFFAHLFLSLHPRTKLFQAMCTVSIKVDEDAIRELADEENDTLDIEEARAIVIEAIREEYSKPLIR